MYIINYIIYSTTQKKPSDGKAHASSMISILFTNIMHFI